MNKKRAFDILCWLCVALGVLLLFLSIRLDSAKKPAAVPVVSPPVVLAPVVPTPPAAPRLSDEELEAMAAHVPRSVQGMNFYYHELALRNDAAYAKQELARRRSWTIEPTYGGAWIVRDAAGVEICGGMSEPDARHFAKLAAEQRGLPEQQLRRITFDWE